MFYGVQKMTGIDKYSNSDIILLTFKVRWNMSKYFRVINNSTFGHNMAEFDMYSRQFDMNDHEIHEKLFHTFKVAEMSFAIAKALGQDAELAFNIGIFHDYARFEQWSKFNSFADHLGFDHGDKSAEQLFGVKPEEIETVFKIANGENIDKAESKKLFIENALSRGDIGKFKLSEDDYLISYLAVKFHNKAQIDLDFVKKFMNAFGENKHSLEEILMQCKIIRDADKMDLFNRIGYGNLEFYSDIDSAEKDKDGNQPNLVTHAHVLDNLKEHKYVEIKYMKTKLDRVLSFIGFLYDLNFPESVSQIDLDSYFESLKENYGSHLIPESQKILNEAIEDAKEYLTLKQKQPE